MDFSTLSGVLSLLKHIPENLAALLVFTAIAASFVLKKKDTDVQGATKIGELQNAQLETLIKMNSALSDQLTAVRGQLDEAHAIISDLRKRVVELEDMLKQQQKPETEETS